MWLDSCFGRLPIRQIHADRNNSSILINTVVNHETSDRHWLPGPRVASDSRLTCSQQWLSHRVEPIGEPTSSRYLEHRCSSKKGSVKEEQRRTSSSTGDTHCLILKIALSHLEKLPKDTNHSRRQNIENESISQKSFEEEQDSHGNQRQMALCIGMANKPASVIPKESPIDATPMENSLLGSGIYENTDTHKPGAFFSWVYFDWYLVECIDICSSADQSFEDDQTEN